jgi:hypothetical protein
LTVRRCGRREGNVATGDATRISVDELAGDVAGVLDRVVHQHEVVVVERNGSDVAVIRPAAATSRRRRRQAPTPADYEAFLATAGAWDGLVDTEQLKADIAASRRLSPRPQLEL